MCGIAGFLSQPRDNSEVLTAAVSAMAMALEARGPDDSGAWVDPGAGIALGHRRLAVIDLSAEGHQPKVSGCGRYVLSFNGEIYNFRALRHELEQHGHGFRGHSDTEVILASVAQWGILEAVTRFNGMFAFAIWDRETRAVTLVRDRLGEKPLYYGWLGDTMVFASDLRAIERHTLFQGRLSDEAVSLYLRFGNVPAPHSIYTGLYKLPPGCLLTLTAADASRRSAFSPFPSDDGPHFRPVRYWSAFHAAQAGIARPFAGTTTEAAEAVDTLLGDSVALRMTADVPLGALLSGGVDSSLIVALMQARSSTPVRTFTIGFADERFNEATHAAAVAAHLGTDHTELYLEAEEARGVIERLPAIYDEPFADASQIPTTLLSALVRRHVTVALSGDGGDELFGGYTRYMFGQSIWGRVGRVPLPLRRAAASLLRIPSSSQWDALSSRMSSLHSRYGVNGTAGDKFHKLAEVLSMPDGDAFYDRLVTVWPNPESILTAPASPAVASAVPNPAPVADIASRMMYRDLIGYLPDDILTKVDRASMSASLEMRVPLLDHRLVEFAWTLPTRMKVADGRSKRVLRDVLDRYVPPELIDRPKMGFGVPIAAWLRGPLRDWAESLLDEQALRGDQLLDHRIVRQRWQEHLSGRRDWTGPLWSILMLQDWRRHRGLVG